MNATIRFSTDKTGKQIAHRFSAQAMRWIRISVDEAEIMRAAGQVKEVCWGEKPNSLGVKCVEQWIDNGVTNSVWMQAA